MPKNSARAKSKKFHANMKAPTFSQKNILLDEAKELSANISKLLYSDSNQKAQMLVDIKKLNDFVKQARIEEYTQLANSKNSTNRLQSTCIATFYTLVLLLGAVVFVWTIFRK